MSSNTVLFDDQIFSLQHHGGISRYFSQLLEFFASDPDVSVSLSVIHSNNAYLREMKLQPGLQPIKQQGQLLANRQETIRRLLSGKFDLFHPTYFDTYFLDYLTTKPFVVTIYDMIHEIFIEHFHLLDPVRTQKRLLAERASKIIAISHNTKKDIIAHYGIDENKIVVIHLATSLKKPDISAIHLPPDFPEEYLLFVGDRWHYKNFYFFLQAVAPIVLNNKELRIVCAGGYDFTKDEILFARSLGLDQKIFHFAIDDTLLAILYSRAKVFVFPSLYEGFGIPVLEAFACGCPVMTSATSSLPEVAGDAALYFQPKDIASLQESLERILHDQQLRNSLIQKGFEQLSTFSWQKTATATKEVYASLLK